MAASTSSSAPEPLAEVEPFQWDESIHAFRSGRRVLSGLCPLLRRVFYPQYSFATGEAATSVCIQGKRGRRVVPLFVLRRAVANSKLPPTVLAPESTPGHLDGALARARAAGSLLDDELTTCVDLARKYSIPHWVFYRLRAGATESWRSACVKCLEGCAKTRAMALKLVEVIEGLHEPVRALWLELERLKLTPIESQVVCGDLAWGCATKADFVCVDEKGGHVVCENKLGYPSSHVGSGCKMNAPLEDCDDTPVNQWDLQALATKMMMTRTYPRRNFAPRPMVFHTKATQSGASGGSAYRSTGKWISETFFRCRGEIDSVLRQAQAPSKKKKVARGRSASRETAPSKRVASSGSSKKKRKKKAKK